MTDPSRRRLLALLGTGATAVLSGCNRIFSRPEPPSTPDVTPPPTPDFLDGEGTATGTPATETRTRTPSLAAVGDVITVSRSSLTMDYLDIEDITTVDVALEITNAGDRGIELVELRVDLVYDPTDERRVVAADYVGVRGLAPGVTTEVRYDTSFPNDGRANGSSDVADFDLAFRIRTLEFGDVETAEASQSLR